MDDNDKALTKQEFREGLAELRQEFRQDLAVSTDGLRDQLRQEFNQRMDEFAASLEETMRDMQTEILRSAMAYQESNIQRFVALETNETVVATLKARVALLEERVLKVEKKINLPPV